MTAKTITVFTAALAIAGSAWTAAQTVTKGTSVTEVLTIQAIDQTAQRITLRSEKGEEDTFTVDPAMVPRFNELKVGDKVKATYYESLVFLVRKPGQPSDPAMDDAALTRAKGALPGGSIAAQQRGTVTVKAVDLKTPSITVTTADGRVVTRKVEEKKNLDNVKPGDRIDITYTQALLVSVERAK